MNVSVVIPTFNRGQKLLPTLHSLLANDTAGISKIDIIVVDDGSTPAAAPIVESLNRNPPFSLSCIRQTNQGPAAARNTGFRASLGEIVLFIDDDILATPDLVRRHVDAHREKPRSVICGRCPLLKPSKITPLFQFLNSLPNDPGAYSSEDFIEIPLVASGQVSVERRVFNGFGYIYRDDLITPAAEEFELSHRLRQTGIHFLLATRIVAQHDHSVDIHSICRQQHKYGIGCAEVEAKYPSAATMKELAGMLRFSRDVQWGDSPKAVMSQSAKIISATRASRIVLLKATQLAEVLLPHSPILKLLYRALIGSHFLAGVREGKRRFASSKADQNAKIIGETS